MRTKAALLSIALLLLASVGPVALASDADTDRTCSLFDIVVEFVLGLFSVEATTVDASEGEPPSDEAGGFVTPVG